MAETHGALCAREPWRVAEGYAREARIDVRPKRDSPLWVMSVNRVHWPEYQQMMTGVGHTLCFTPASAEVLNASTCPYPPPLVPPIELELLYDQVPVDHSWGASCRRDDHAAGRQPSGGASSCALPLVLPTPSIRELHMVAVDTSTQKASRGCGRQEHARRVPRYGFERCACTTIRRFLRHVTQPQRRMHRCSLSSSSILGS